MKLVILVFSMLAISSMSQAGDSDSEKKMSMEAKKAKVAANIDKRIASLGEFKTCIVAASAKGDIKACRQKHKDRVKSLKMDKKHH